MIITFRKIAKIIFSHLTSQKVLMTLFGVGIIHLAFLSGIGYVFRAAALLPPDVAKATILAVVSLYKDYIVAVSAIVFAALGIKGILDWKYSSASSALTDFIKQDLHQESKQEIEFVKRSPKDFDDGSID